MKKFSPTTGNSGFLRLIITIIIALIIASYFFDFNLQGAIEDENTQSNLQYLWSQIENFYYEYLEPFFSDIIEYVQEFVASLND